MFSLWPNSISRYLFCKVSILHRQPLQKLVCPVHNKHMLKNKDQAGFVPMLVMIIIVLGVVVWLGYKHVSDAHQKKILQKANQVESSLSQ